MVVLGTVPPFVYFISSLPCPVWRHLQFPKLNNICHFSDDLINVLKSTCKCCLSASLLIHLNTFVSYANVNNLLVISSQTSWIYIKNTYQSSIKSSSKSLLYINNKIGPNTEPCHTQTDFFIEDSPSTTTLCLLSISPFFIQLIIAFPILCNCHSV